MRGAPDEHDRGDEDQHRQREVAHHPAVVELAFHGQAAEHRLRDHAQRQQRAQPHQLAAVRAPAQRAQPRQAGGDRDRDRDHAVGELDQRVRSQRRVDVAVALRPGRAAEARAGQAHRGAGQHDQRQRAQRHLGDAQVLLGGEGVAVRALAQALQSAAHRPTGCQVARDRVEGRIMRGVDARLRSWSPGPPHVRASAGDDRCMEGRSRGGRGRAR